MTSKLSHDQIGNLKRNLASATMNEHSQDLAIRCSDALQYIEQLEQSACEDQVNAGAVSLFATAMNEKMKHKRQAGREGWRDTEDCSQSYLSDLLRASVLKGDPVDIANFAMMLWNRQQNVLPAAHEASVVGQPSHSRTEALPAIPALLSDAEIAFVIRFFAELLDRDSPADAPGMMLVDENDVRSALTRLNEDRLAAVRKLA